MRKEYIKDGDEKILTYYGKIMKFEREHSQKIKAWEQLKKIIMDKRYKKKFNESKYPKVLVKKAIMLEKVIGAID